MRYITLEGHTDPETGELGLIIKGNKITNYPMVATNGILIAHDLIEHQQGIDKIGGIGDELLALGGVWYTRGQHCDIARPASYHDPVADIAVDLLNLAGLALNGVPLRIRVPKFTCEHDHDDSFTAAIDQARADFRSEYRASPEHVSEFWDAALHLMRQGYNMARKRFERRGGSRYTANSMFWNIADAVAPYAASVEYEGQQFRLAYDRDSASVEKIYEPNDWY